MEPCQKRFQLLAWIFSREKPKHYPAENGNEVHQNKTNPVAQRKLQLDNIGWLAANKNVSIPPESSKELAALNSSFNEQSASYSKEWPGLLRYGHKNPQLGRTLEDLINGYLDVNDAVKMISKPQTE